MDFSRFSNGYPSLQNGVNYFPFYFLTFNYFYGH